MRVCLRCPAVRSSGPGLLHRLRTDGVPQTPAAAAELPQTDISRLQLAPPGTLRPPPRRAQVGSPHKTKSTTPSVVPVVGLKSNTDGDFMVVVVITH